MSLLSDETATKKARFRVKTAGTKLNREELSALEKHCQERGTSPGELIRQLILRELRQNAGDSIVSAELTEAIGLRLMLTNLLKPIATGQKITPEIFDAIMAEVRKTKREVAVEVQRQAEGL
jgi:cyclopropane fatty-acyl-phospholipid synthase-like methyltransferase